MSLENLRNQTFPSITKKDWKEKAEESLKGKTIESLQTPTYENITLKPLYSRQDEKAVAAYPGGTDFRRGVHSLGYVTNSWKVAQQVSSNSLGELKNKLGEAMEKGQTALSFEVSRDLVEGNANLDFLMDLSEKYPFAINGKGFQPALLAKLARTAEQLGKADKITGYVANDPISIFAEEGLIPDGFFEKWAEDVKLANEKLPELRTILINTSIYHQNGANAVQELGVAAAIGVFYLQQLLDTGMNLEEALPKMVFQFSIGGNFFMELAKLRAARILWNKITEVYGADAEVRGMHISAETSPFTKTVYDPHVNILRAGNEAFAAVVGGVQYLQVTPFDAVTGSTPLSERIARNTQNILKEEAHLQKVIDPAGGSWYVEALTTELAEKAWGYFQQIEANGGILEVLKSGWIQTEMKEVNAKRQQDVFTRKQSIVGTNVYANVDELGASEKGQTSENYFVQATIRELLETESSVDDKFLKLTNFPSAMGIEAITKTRLSEPFENLRKISAVIENKVGSKPQVGMICLGELKQYKARLDFMRGFVAAGGLEAAASKSITSYETAKQFILSQDTKYFCLCGSNDQYELLGHDILSALLSEFPDRIFYLAGLPEKDMQSEWFHEGIKQFIHVKSNCYETLSAMLTEMEVQLDEVAKA